MATCKFNVGDMVIGNHPTKYGVTKKGWIGKVTDVGEDRISVYGQGVGCMFTFAVDPQYFDLYHEEKIVITRDGKTTTATKYCADGSKVTATARCAPEDEFDFNVGAKLAMERLTEKTKPVVEWRVVDRKPRVGDYIRLKTTGCYHWNKPGDILKVDVVKHETLVAIYGKNHIRPTDDQDFLWNYTDNEYEVVEKVTKKEEKKEEKKCNIKFNTGDYAKIIAKKHGHCFAIGTIVKLEKNANDYLATADGGESWWVTDEELEAYTPPKYYNGKVVCIASDLPRDLTVGKIYNFVDGLCENDWGGQITYSPITSVDDLNARFLGYEKFIPLVEDENKPLTIEEIRKMDGQKVYVVRLDGGKVETPDHSFCGWHTVNLEENKLIDSNKLYYYITSMDEAHGYHAYRQAPLK